MSGRVSHSAGAVLAALASTLSAHAASPVRVPVCASGALAPVFQTNGATGAIIVDVTLWNAGGRACRASGRLAFAVRDDRTGRLVQIMGNPYTELIAGRIHPRANSGFALEWTNYCGPLRFVQLVAHFSSTRTVARNLGPAARCDSPSVPSTFRVFKLRG